MQTSDEYDHQCPTVFYVTENVPGPGINLQDFELEFSSGCDCKNFCNETCPCTRGVVNYTNGRITNLTTPIIECNPSCSCSETCGNRVVQSGPVNCLFVSETPSRGFGLFTKSRIQKGSFVCEYAGEAIGVEEAKNRVEKNRRCKLNNYVLIYVENVGNENEIVSCVDPAVFGNIGRYSNHSCCPNTQVFAVRVNRSTPRLCLFASKDIEENEEITFNYAQGLGDVSCASDTKCLCGSENCKGYLPHQPI